MEIVSGGAYGIDAAAHNAALEAGGISVAVLGTGIDRDYPRLHASLYKRLSEHGACITEFAPGSDPLPGHFPIRNRLIAGLSRGVVVIEAGEKSGALITARFALEQNREVFAVPGQIWSELSVGPHRLIRSGAVLVTSVDDILEEVTSLFSGVRRDSVASVAGVKAGAIRVEGEAGAIYELLDETPKSIDILVRESGHPPAKVLEFLMELELKEAVVQLPGHQYVRK
jgi:DNA processing protein